MEWGLGGGRMGGREFLGGGAGKIPCFLLQIQKKLTKIWKFSPNSKKPKISQNLKYHFKTANSDKYYQKLELITKLLKPQI
jgi:hypothetical protein